MFNHGNDEESRRGGQGGIATAETSATLATCSSLQVGEPGVEKV